MTIRSPFPQITSPPQSAAEILVNLALESLKNGAVYAKDGLNCSGLTWAYLGGRWGGFPITAGTLTLTDNATNYIVVKISDGTISTSTATTHWTDSTNYARTYAVTLASGVVTTEDDYRAGAGGLGGGAGGGGGGGGSSNGAPGGVPRVSTQGDGTTALSTSSTTFVDLTGFPAKDMPASVGDILEIEFNAGAYLVSGAVQSVFVGFDINGSFVPAAAVTLANAGYEAPLVARIERVVLSGDLSAGVVPIKPKWKVDGGSVAFENSANVVPLFTVKNFGDGTGILVSKVVTDATSNHNVVNADNGAYLRMTDAAANTVTFQLQATAPLSPGFEVSVRCASAGGTTLTPAAGVTLNAPAGGSLVLSAGMTILAKWVGSDEWDVMGQTS